jgi:hypothetical protein
MGEFAMKNWKIAENWGLENWGMSPIFPESTILHVIAME